MNEVPDAPTTDRWVAPVLSALDDALATLDSHGPECFNRALADALATLREAAGPAWTADVVPIVRRHRATQIARECPLTRHATVWPRGYPGDAGLLDIIYRHQPGDGRDLSERARRLHAAIQAGAPPRSVRQRRMLLADAIDEAAVATPGVEIMSVACGHLREAEWSLALAGNGISRFIAADQDRDSLSRLDADYGARFPVIAPTPLSVRDLLSGKTATLGRFNLIYAAGLFDYLPEAIARALTERLFGLLHPGGRLLIGNFGVGIPETAFMEAVMDWPLLWRSPVEIAAFASGIADSDVASKVVWPDATGTCWYLDIRRRSALASQAADAMRALS